MAIKVGEKDLFPYLGDYGPVSIYKGEQKIAGYKWAEKSGQELHFDNTYNSHVEVEVDGKSYQDGTPSPDIPKEIHSLNDFDVVSDVGRNLVLDSNNILMGGSDNGNRGLAVKKGDYVSITPATNGNVYANGSVKTSLERVQGETYTVSLEVNTLESTRMYWYPSNTKTFNGIIPNTNGEWAKISHTYTQVGETKSGDTGFLWGFDSLTAGNEIKYRNLKLEKGSKSTPYTPAPEEITENEEKIYPLQSLEDWRRYYKNSPAIVTNPNDIAYQEWGFSGVPLENMEQVRGGMFGSAFPIHGNLNGGIDTPATAWAGINISRVYLETNDATLLPKIRAIGDFFINHTMDIDIWGIPLKAMPNAVTFDEVSRQWIPSTRFIHTRTFYHVAWALLEIYDATGDTKYSSLAGQLLDGATIPQLITTGQANSNELPPYFSGAMFNTINNVDEASYEPDWTTFTNTNGDVVVRATNKWMKLFGNSTRASFDLYAWENKDYTVKSIADDYISHLVYLYNNQDLRKSDGHNLLYNFSRYEWEDEPHPDGYTLPVPMNWDFVNEVFGQDQWFTGDLMFWAIIGFAEAGETQIATSLLDRYYELKAPDSEGRLLFHDRYTEQGTPLAHDTSKSIAFTALYMQARNILGNHDYDEESLGSLEYYQKESTFNTVDGGFSWDTEEYNSFIENKSLGEILFSIMENVAEDSSHLLIDKINLSLSEPLRSVGDVKDRLFKDSDNLWKVERNVGKVELKGTKGWSADHYRVGGYNYAYFRPDNFKARGEVRSNILPLGDILDDTRETIGKTSVIAFNLRDSRTGVNSTDTVVKRIQKIRDYLFSIEGAMVSYELATPTIETLDQELQNKLNNLRSFYGSNYVYTVLPDDDLTPTLHAKTEVKDI